ncbi:GHKL domain-containing protein [Paenibacillus oenotherae]|uniref:GHKL domain-containing protein n=1 Tax=Paenibacillus oenotherae TaxID=1435645 RepID=A0ABS7D7W2_9BACL|nr:GHKL domain-containing protein [Paenibacillus oenotherae]
MINRYRRTSLILVSSLIALLIGNNMIYYFISKNTLEEKTLNDINNESIVLNKILENSREGARFVEALVGEKLRSDSIAIQSQIDPDINHVTNEQLDALSEKLNIKAITLLTKTKDASFHLTKSSHREEINLDTKRWGLWNKAFLELYDRKNVTALNWGQSLPNYWTGPFSISDTNAEEFYKYGYYYDGTTNYLINPFVSDKVFKDYDKLIGINSIIHDVTSSNRSVIEVSGINPATFGKEQIEVENGTGQKYTLRYYIPIFFGSYEYKNEKLDSEYIQKAIDTKELVSYKAELNGKTVLKAFIPVFTNKIDELGVITENSEKELDKTLNYYVMAITIDYQAIQSQLNQILWELLLVVIVITVICIILLVMLNKFISKTKDQAVTETQSAYIDEMNSLFTSIRGQRHDFLNHISTISALVELDKIKELKEYTGELVEDVLKINDIISIGQPAIAALVQSKSVSAEVKDIQFTFSFTTLKEFPEGVRSVDCVRAIGNLVDNAFDEVMKLPKEERIVKLIGEIESGILKLSVYNKGTIHDAIIEKIFEAGISSKNAQEHSGLGLAITLDIVRKYKGSIRIDNSDGVTFVIEIPINQYAKAIYSA